MQRKYLIVLLVLALCVFGTAGASQIIGGVTPPETFVTPPETTTVPPTTTHTTTVPPTTIVTTQPTFITPETTITITLVTIAPGGGKGWIDVYSNVDGATVYFDGTPEGTTAGGILSVAVAVAGTPVRQITVSKSGYNSWQGPLSRMPAEGEHVQVYATLNPIPTQTTVSPVQTGSIYAQSSPAGAAIYLNGNFKGYASLTIPDLAPGSYSIKAVLNGYTPDVQTVHVYAGSTTPYYPSLQPSPPPPRQTGTVTVTSQPGAAFIYVDGNYQGKAPLTTTQYTGSHSFRLSLSGYNDYTQTLYVNAGTNQQLNAILTPAVYGTVAVTSMPGASVSMDNDPQGTIPSSGTMTIYNVANGNRLFKVSARGYNDWLNSIYVQPNTLTSFTATLVPVGPSPTQAPPTGSINVVSAPAGAELYVDNLFRGYTPMVLGDLSPGQHTILLKYTGYVDYTGTATVNSGQTTPLSIAMMPAPTPTPKSGLSIAATAGRLQSLQELLSVQGGVNNDGYMFFYKTYCMRSSGCRDNFRAHGICLFQ